jgi:predicted lipid-binding transport protein (Tim44 family)
MSRRPELTKAILWAGLICVLVFLSAQAWSRENAGIPVRPDKAARAEATGPFQSFQVAGRQAAPGSRSRSAAPADTAPSGQSLILRWLTGGLLGSLFYHAVFGYPLSNIWQEGPWPPGPLDILALAGLGFLGYHWYKKLKGSGQPAETGKSPGFLRPEHKTQPMLSVREEAKPGLADIQERDQDFDLQAFGEDICSLVQEVYSDWNREEFKSLNGRVRESLLEYLQMGLKIISLREERSYLEELAVEGITITAAGVNDGKEFITVQFHGRVLDYVLDKSSGKLLLGSMAYPAIFQEFWDLERPLGQSPWVLQDIREK